MPRKKRTRPVLGRDYIIDETGRAQFTREYLIAMKECCGHNCRFCPYSHVKHDTTVQDQRPCAVNVLTNA